MNRPRSIYTKTISKALIELSEDIIKNVTDFSSSAKLLAHIQKIRLFHAFASGFMSEEGKEKAEKLASELGKDLDKAYELFRTITNDKAIMLLMQEGVRNE